jgi:hypothetical protein
VLIKSTKKTGMMNISKAMGEFDPSFVRIKVKLIQHKESFICLQ